MHTGATKEGKSLHVFLGEEINNRSQPNNVLDPNQRRGERREEGGREEREEIHTISDTVILSCTSMEKNVMNEERQ